MNRDWRSKLVRMLLGVLGGLLVFVVGGLGWAWLALFGPGLTNEHTARILVTDAKFGGRAVDKAVRSGDAILPSLRRVSGDFDFERVSGRNAMWMAEALSAMDTEEVREILRDLYGRSNRVAHLVGAVGLSRQRALPERITADAAVLGAVAASRPTVETDLAILALGWSGDPSAVPVLERVLTNRPAPYQQHARACAALARLGADSSAAILRDCLRSREFHALPEAFRALIALGDREAVPLAIARVDPSLRPSSGGFLVNELRRVTGQSYGYEREDWERWWRAAEPTWKIPPVFRRL